MSDEILRLKPIQTEAIRKQAREMFVKINSNPLTDSQGKVDPSLVEIALDDLIKFQKAVGSEHPVFRYYFFNPVEKHREDINRRRAILGKAALTRLSKGADLIDQETATQEDRERYRGDFGTVRFFELDKLEDVRLFLDSLPTPVVPIQPSPAKQQPFIPQPLQTRHHASEILRFKPGEVAQLFAEGKMKAVNTSPPVLLKEPHMSVDSMIERAKELLGKDFLGVEAVRNMESKLKEVGGIEFVIDKLPPFLYTEEDLQVAKATGEMLILRPEVMLRGGIIEVPLTMVEFREFFRKDRAHLGKMQKEGFSFTLSDDYNLSRIEIFATSVGEIKLGWSLVKKDVLYGSTDTNWNDQDQLLRQYEAGLRRKGIKNVFVKRRTATEAVYDELLYYLNTGVWLLPNKYDWTRTLMPDGSRVCVGDFDAGGLSVNGRLPGGSLSIVGVCPSR